MTTCPVLIVHGGAFNPPEHMRAASRQGVKDAATLGYRVLCCQGSALDAVVEAVTAMEDNPVFDAGKGSTLTSAGTIEMDAMVLDGRNLDAGAVACVQHVANPVQLAKMVMDKTPHTCLAGDGALAFAKEMGVPLKTTEELSTEDMKRELQQFTKYNSAVIGEYSLRADALRPVSNGHDTVGAVALDCHGNLAVATSTGGITARRPGRVGDTPLIGGGGYCDNAIGGVSTTGHGESISRVCLAHRILTLMGQGLGPEAAISQALTFMAERVGGAGGAIAIGRDGQVSRLFTSEFMAWASICEGVMTHGMAPGEFLEQKLTLDV